MEWIPSFECDIRPDGEHVYRIGHRLIDEFLEFVVGRARPNTVRAYAHDLRRLLQRGAKGSARGAAQRRDGLRHGWRTSSQGGLGERGPHLRRLGWFVGHDDQASLGCGLEFLRLSDHQRRRGGEYEPSAPRPSPRVRAALEAVVACRWSAACVACPGSSILLRSMR